MDTPSVPALPDQYEIERRPLRGGRREDWEVRPVDEQTVLDAPDVTAALRRMFADLFDETQRRADDPIAVGRALLKVQTLLGDLRALESEMRTTTAEAMSKLGVRRIALDSVGVWEFVSSARRSDWQTARLVSAYLAARGLSRAVSDDGEFIEGDQIGELVADLYGTSSAPRVTPLRDAGLNPDDFCTLELDEDEKPIRTPSIKVSANNERSRR